MSRLIWHFKQLFPLLYFTTYTEEDKRYAVSWRMWLGRSFNEEKYQIVK